MIGGSSRALPTGPSAYKIDSEEFGGLSSGSFEPSAPVADTAETSEGTKAQEVKSGSENELQKWHSNLKNEIDRVVATIRNKAIHGEGDSNYEGEDSLRAMACIEEFTHLCQCSPFVYAAYNNPFISTLGSNRIQVIDLLTIMILFENRIDEHASLMARRISELCKDDKRSASDFFLMRASYDAEPGRKICETVIHHCLLCDEVEKAITFVSHLTCNNLKVGASEYLARRLLAHPGFDLLNIPNISDLHIRSFLYYRLALLALPNSHEVLSYLEEIHIPELQSEIRGELNNHFKKTSRR